MHVVNSFSNYQFYRLVGDNIDHQINARIQSKDHKNQSIHWTHEYAIRDSVVDIKLDNSKPKKMTQQLSLTELLRTLMLNIDRSNH